MIMNYDDDDDGPSEAGKSQECTLERRRWRQ